MKPTKKVAAKKVAKKKPAKKAYRKDSIVGKLLQLKYRINEWYQIYGEDTSDDKTYVMSLISDIRKHGFTKLAPEDHHCCNGLWRRYEIK
tara:strand:+ start:614 stop:883 length:270 start_codon:yes stop_codon:yes gene_type:complete